MKKNVKKALAATLALLAAGAFIGCSQDGSSSDPFSGNKEDPIEKPEAGSLSGDLIKFEATGASVNADDVMLIVKYDRTAYGAAEKIKLTNVNLKVTYNGTTVKMPSEIDFTLDEYGASFSNGGTPIADAKDMVEYKAKLPLGKKIKAGDVVTVQLLGASVSGEGAKSVALGSIIISLIDTNPKADNGNHAYYFELCPNEKEYQPLITNIPGTIPEEKPEDKPEITDPVEYKVPEVPALPEDLENAVSVFSSLQTGDSVWGSGTKIESFKDTAYLVTSGTGWDPNGMATMPVCTSIADADVLIITLDASNFKVRDDSAEYPSYEVKVEGESSAYVINATSYFNNGVAVVPLADAKAAVSDAKQFTLNIRGSGTIVLAQLTLASEKKGGDAPSEGGEGSGDDTPAVQLVNVTPVFTSLQAGENVWGSGTNTIANEDGTYLVTSGTGWDPSGMATMPVCTSIADKDVLIISLDASNFTVRDGSAEYPSYEVKVEGESTAYVINATEYFQNGVAVVPLFEAKAAVSDAKQFTLNIRGTGTIILNNLALANLQ